MLFLKARNCYCWGRKSRFFFGTLYYVPQASQVDQNQYQFRQMSNRKFHNKKIQPILATLEQTLQLSLKETQIQEEIDRAIIEQLIQTDVISKIKSTDTLKLIIYELILVCYQQTAKKVEVNNENALHHSRIKNLLWAIKQVLTECYLQNEEISNSVPSLKTERVNFSGERSVKNKFRIFSSYFNQFNSLVDQLQPRSKQPIYSDDDCKEQALISQLQSLVYKKDEQLKLAKQECLAQIDQNKLLEEKIQFLNDELELTKKLNIELTSQKQSLAQNLKLFLTKSDKIDQPSQQNEQNREQSLWEQGFRIKKQLTQNGELNQLLQMIMSQAMTIQALIT